MYRGDIDPLKAKETALASELSSLRRREREVARALDDTRAEVRRARTVLPVLEDVRIASPCSASWDEMTGDARVRFCGKCAKNVYNLSEMTRDEGEALLAKSEGRLCVRLYQRKDGTVITADCPVGMKKKRARRVLLVAAAALGAGTAAMAMAATTMGERQPPPDHAMMGDVAAPAETASAPTSVGDPAAMGRVEGRAMQGAPAARRK